MEEKTSIRTLFLNDWDAIFNSIIRIVKERELAEDLIQDLFIKTIEIESKGQYNEEQKFLPFIIKVGRNLIMDYYRKEKRMIMIRDNDEYSVFDTLRTENSNVEDSIIQKERYNEATVILEKLKPKEREIINRRINEELSYAEISKKYDINESTARVRFHDAKINIQKIIKESKLPKLPKLPKKIYLSMSEKTENNIGSLREHLFETLRKLEGGTMKADEAKAMASVAQTIINSAKLELDYKRLAEKNPQIKMLNE